MDKCSIAMGDYMLESCDDGNYTLTRRTRPSCGKPEYVGEVDENGEIVSYYYCFEARSGAEPIPVSPPPFARLLARELLGKLRIRAAEQGESLIDQAIAEAEEEFSGTVCF